MADGRRLVAVGLLGLAWLAGSSQAYEPDAAVVAAEAKQLSALSANTERQGLRLKLKAANGSVVHFDSQRPDDEHEAQVADYRLAGTTPDGRFFIVHARFYEGESTYWVSRATGMRTEVYASPDVSPDGRFAVTALSAEAYGPEGVFVWEIVGDQLVQRAHLKNGDYGLFTFKRWLGKDMAELELFSHSFLNFCAGANSTTATVRLMRGSQGWTLAAPASASEVRCE